MLFQMVASYDKCHFNLSYTYSFTAFCDYKDTLEIVSEFKESQSRKGVRNVDR